jgi:hypothetical protein
VRLRVHGDVVVAARLERRRWPSSRLVSRGKEAALRRMLRAVLPRRSKAASHFPLVAAFGGAVFRQRLWPRRHGQRPEGGRYFICQSTPWVPNNRPINIPRLD